MAITNKDLGIATAYGEYKAAGGTKTRAEFREMFLNFEQGVTGAEAAAREAAQSATAASGSATQASSAASLAAESAGTAHTDAQTAANAAAGVRADADRASAAATESEEIRDLINGKVNAATQAASTASTAAGNAANSASEAQTAAQTATQKASEIVASAEAAQQAKEDAVSAKTAAQTAAQQAGSSEASASSNASAAAGSAQTASTAAQTATTKASEADQSASDASGAAQTATTKATEATTAATLAQSYAKGDTSSRAGEATDNAQYYKEQAEAAKTAAEAAAASITVDATLTQSGKAADAKATGDKITELKNDLTDLIGAKRYGVSGIEQSASALTRIYDSVGMVAEVGTDGDNSSIRNDFDNAEPFKRRKCVGEWNLVNGKAQFHVNAYLGDDDYAEDGSMGDYVAVECPRCYYKMEDGQLIISAYHYSGYRPFDIFCRNHDVNDTIPFYYLPAYPLVLNEGGHAVCLPGYDNEQGCYKELLDAARTYKDGALGNLAIIQPMAVNFYEWALFTVEFAEQHCQSVMQGCAGLRHNNDDRVMFVDSTHILTSNYYTSRVAGQRICIIETDIDINNKNYLATHEVVSVTRCDANGQASTSGTHQLLEISDLGRAYFTYDITGATEYKIAARPYPTGACNNVSTPSGSPVSNTDSFHPMKYRWRENIYANQYKTIVDLFNKRVGTDDSDYILEHYLLVDPTGYEPSANSKPDATDLDTDKFVLLDIQTEHENYVNGYVKSKKYSDVYPDVWIPHETSGASASTYFADYASLVSSYVVRSVRLGGSWSFGAYVGLSIFFGYIAPSSSIASFGADLCFAQ